MMAEKKLKLRTDPRNARIHPPRNLEAVKRSLDELGAGRSIVVDKDGVAIGGSAVLEKAVELGLDMKLVHTKGDKLIVVVRDDLATDDLRRKALALADNQIALLAEWDLPLLEEIKLEIGDIDLDVMGFEMLIEPVRKEKPKPLNTPGDLNATEAEQEILDGKEIIVVYFSGGKDSTCSLLWAVHNADGRSVVPVYCDMGVDYPAMSDHCRTICARLDLELTVVKPGGDFWEMLEREGWPHFQYPWCQHKMLYPALDMVSAEASEPSKILKVGGGSKKESSAISTKQAVEKYGGLDTYFPMYSWGKADIDRVLSGAGVPSWSGYKRGFARTACWMCPGQRPIGYAALRKWYPGLWRELLSWENRLGIGAWNPAGQKPGTGFLHLANKGERDFGKFLEAQDG